MDDVKDGPFFRVTVVAEHLGHAVLAGVHVRPGGAAVGGLVEAPQVLAEGAESGVERALERERGLVADAERDPADRRVRDVDLARTSCRPC